MSHPFVSDLSSKSLEELSETMHMLNKKVAIMSRLNKPDMLRQLHLVLENYRAEYQKRQQELWNKKSQNLDQKIDIS